MPGESPPSTRLEMNSRAVTSSRICKAPRAISANQPVSPSAIGRISTNFCRGIEYWRGISRKIRIDRRQATYDRDSPLPYIKHSPSVLLRDLEDSTAAASHASQWIICDDDRQ